MKAILLTGGHNPYLYPITQHCPKSLLPVLNVPLIEWQLMCLANHGIRQVGVSVSVQDVAHLHEYFQDGRRWGLELTYFVEELPIGPAGCLKLFEAFLAGSAFLVFTGNVLVHSLDLHSLIDFHKQKQAAATVAWYGEPSGSGSGETIHLTAQDQIDKIVHRPREADTVRRFAGIYLFNAEVLSLIKPHVHMDIKEQLIPAINQAGLSVYGRRVNGWVTSINTLDDYYNVHPALLLSHPPDTGRYRQLAPAIWAEESSRISPTAYLLGPVVIGKQTVIGDGAQVIGPTVIGDYCHFGKGCLVRESIIWSHAAVADSAKVEYVVIGSNFVVKPQQSLSRAVVMPRSLPVAWHQKREWTSPVKLTDSPPFSVRIGSALRRGMKRAIDLTFGTLALILALPLFLAIAMIIKLDTAGPVFFVQTRYGADGKPFKMVKFRTMIPNAVGLQSKLRAQNDVDGPVFKIFADPRVTRVGHVLRRYSIDEIPQFYNVVRGHMSLVGPRPLIMEEMCCSPSWRDFRLSVKPGITGMWQLYGRGKTAFHDWIRYDMHYAKHWSLRLDMKILIKTAVLVLRKQGT